MRLIALAPALLALSIAAPAFAGTIAIEGRGEVSAAPDMATINSGVTSRGATAREALDANTAAMTELLETLKSAGIESRDIQTSNFTVSPDYSYTEERDANGYTLPPRINGYVVSNSVTVIVRDLEALGTILDSSVDVGANTVNGVTFAVADPAELYDDAREAAFADARNKAELYAGLAGGELSEIVTISETQGYNDPQPYAMYARAEMAADAPVPVEAGELTFAINVRVEWTLDGDTK
jgi:uncharacterized protein YggE